MAEPSDLKTELAALDQLLGDTRRRFHQRKTPMLSSEPLAQVDREIRSVLVQPPSPELQLEVRRLTRRLRALDPQAS